LSDFRDRRLERLAADLHAIKTTLLRMEQRLLHIDASLARLATGRPDSP
jgi:hypothetical protein